MRAARRDPRKLDAKMPKATNALHSDQIPAAQASGPIITGFGSWFLDPRTLPYLKLDVEGAKKLLADYPNGFVIEIKPIPPRKLGTRA